AHGLASSSKHWRVRKAYQLDCLLGEPVSGGRIDDAPGGVHRALGRPTGAGSIRLAWHLDPQVGVDQLLARLQGGPQAEARAGSIAPSLRVALRGVGRGRPGTLTVAARIDNKRRRGLRF